MFIRRLTEGVKLLSLSEILVCAQVIDVNNDVHILMLKIRFFKEEKCLQLDTL